MSDHIEIPVLYSNAINLRIMLYDFIIIFSINEPIIDEKGNQQNVIKPLTKISLSPHHFKAFTNMCVAQLKGYEEQFGEIKLPKPKTKKK